MTEVYRQDTFHFDAASGFDPLTGLFRGKAVLARVGVFPFRRADGSIQQEFVPPETLFDEAWLQSCQMAPVTNNHPPEMVHKDNADKYVVGQLGETLVRKTDRIEAPIGVHRKDALEAMQAGKLQGSCGYTCVLLHKSGEYQGTRYDVVQTKRRCNHFAIVDRGNHGPEVRIRMDGAAAMVADDQVDDPAPAPARSKTMATVNLGRYTVDVGDAAAAQAISRRLDELDQEIKVKDAAAAEHKARADKAEGERDAVKAEAEQVRKDAAQAGTKAEQAVRARIELEGRARKVLGADARFDGKSDDELRVEVLKKLDDKFDGTGKSGEYLAGRFDVAIEAHESKTAPVVGARRDVAPTGTSKDADKRFDSAEDFRAQAIRLERARLAGADLSQAAK